MSYAISQLPFLKKARRCCGKERDHLLGNCSKEQVFALCECFENLFRNKKFPLTARQKLRLKKHLIAIKNILDRAVSWKQKRKFFTTQEGKGLVTTVLSIAIPALISYLASK